MDMNDERKVLMKVLELIILRHQVKIVTDYIDTKNDGFGFMITSDNSFEEVYNFIIDDVKEILPRDYELYDEGMDTPNCALVGFYKGG